jgi:hypothetical protein
MHMHMHMHMHMCMQMCMRKCTNAQMHNCTSAQMLNLHLSTSILQSWASEVCTSPLRLTSWPLSQHKIRIRLVNITSVRVWSKPTPVPGKQVPGRAHSAFSIQHADFLQIHAVQDRHHKGREKTEARRRQEFGCERSMCAINFSFLTTHAVKGHGTCVRRRNVCTREGHKMCAQGIANGSVCKKGVSVQVSPAGVRQADQTLQSLKVC